LSLNARDDFTRAASLQSGRAGRRHATRLGYGGESQGADRRARDAMAKKLRLRRSVAKSRPSPSGPRTRRAPHDDAPIHLAAPASSEPMRLAAEVARLETELALMRARVAELELHAERDPLTGVANRRGFERELERAAAHVGRYGGNVALVYLDLDNFKPVNDRNGHAAGDAILKAVAAALATSVRASDTVGRIGGDEFAVLLWNLSANDARSKADLLERAVAAASVPWGGQTLTVSATAGVADLGPDADTARLVTRADADMYARKRRQR
jgi:diguanylate cyclase (GGDEF)-like protein